MLRSVFLVLFLLMSIRAVTIWNSVTTPATANQHDRIKDLENVVTNLNATVQILARDLGIVCRTIQKLQEEVENTTKDTNTNTEYLIDFTKLQTLVNDKLEDDLTNATANIGTLDTKTASLREDFKSLVLRFSGKSVIGKGVVSSSWLSTILGDDNSYSADKATDGNREGTWANTQSEINPRYTANIGPNKKMIMTISLYANSQHEGNSYMFFVINGSSEEQCAFYKPEVVGMFETTVACGKTGDGFMIMAYSDHKHGIYLVIHEVKFEILLEDF